MGSDSENRDSDEEVYGPVLPPKPKAEEKESEKRIMGPSLPPSVIVEDNLVEDVFGPALPPHLLKRKREEEKEEEEATQKRKSLSQEISENRREVEDDDDDEVVGPVPVDCPSASKSFAQQKLEERAWRLKTDFLNKGTPEDKKREEWMTELPAARSAIVGLGPRKFRSREGPDMSDRSCWSDTPADRARKEKERLEKLSYENPRKNKGEDKKRSSARKEEKKSRKHEKSLLELHQEKIKKKQKEEKKAAKESGRTLRRPFDGDIDLKICALSHADKKAMLKKSQALDDRFCRERK